MQPDSPPEDLRKLAVLAQDAIREAAQPDATQEAQDAERGALAALRNAVFPALPEPDTEEALRDALPEAAKAADDGAALDVLRAALSPLRPLRTWAGKTPPDAVLWGVGSERTVLRRGEVALLGSAGGMGKSFLTLALAHCAAEGVSPTCCGFGVAHGAAALIGYEDSPAEVARRVSRIREAAAGSRNPDAIPDRLHLLPEPPPLFVANPDVPGAAARSPQWGAIFAAVRALDPVLVVIDPASAALSGVSANETVPVRAFLAALRREAEEGNFGVLVVAHDTKAARNEAAAGGDPGAGAVSGSAAWWDAARAVLYMRGAAVGDDRIVQARKANYGRTGWGVRLAEVHLADGRFAGFRELAALDKDGVAAAVKKRRGGKGKAGDPDGADGGEEAQGEAW